MEASAFFRRNLQQETNLHNFATSAFENTYYFGSFLALVALPLLHWRLGLMARWPALALFVPAPMVMLAGTAMIGWNYDMWNILLTPFAVFVTAGWLWQWWRSGSGEAPVALALLLLVVTQLVFLLLGERLVRDWDPTEYKECLIPLAFLLYAIDLQGRRP